MNKSLALKNKLYLFLSLVFVFLIFLYLIYFLKDKEYNNVKSSVNNHRDVFGSDNDLQGLVNNTAINNLN